MLDPQRAVLIEGGDARLGEYVLRARPIRRGADEVDDRLFRGSAVPRRQRIGLRVRRKTGNEDRAERRNRYSTQSSGACHSRSPFRKKWATNMPRLRGQRIAGRDSVSRASSVLTVVLFVLRGARSNACL